MAYVIAVLNQKGGAGKSTLATNIATSYARQRHPEGKNVELPGAEGETKSIFRDAEGAAKETGAVSSLRVLLADADPQGTARNWRATGPSSDEHGKAFPDVVGADTPEAIETVTGPEVAGAFDVVVIDGPPGVSKGGPGEVTVAALKAADLVLIPVRPSGADLWATSDLAELVQTRQDATGSPDAAFVVMQADSRTNVAKEIGGALGKLGLPALDARCGFRVAYTKALGKGLAVEDVKPGGKAAGEIEAIANEIETRFHA